MFSSFVELQTRPIVSACSCCCVFQCNTHTSSFFHRAICPHPMRTSWITSFFKPSAQLVASRKIFYRVIFRAGQVTELLTTVPDFPFALSHVKRRLSQQRTPPTLLFWHRFPDRNQIFVIVLLLLFFLANVVGAVPIAASNSIHKTALHIFC